MKESLTIALVLMCISITNGQQIPAKQQKEQVRYSGTYGLKTDNPVLNREVGEAEIESASIRAQYKRDFDAILQKSGSAEADMIMWNEYFDYATSKGPDALSAHGSWSNISCNTIDHQVGKGGAMGRMNCVRTDPSNVNIVYAGSPSGGLWKSVNGGDSWSCITDGLPRIGVTDVAINPLNGNEIYMLTGDGEYGLSPCIGVLKSYNGGYTWQPTGLMFVNNTALSFNDSVNIYGRKLLISPSNPDILYAATTDGIYKTMDGGATWPKIYSNNDIWEINFKPAFDTVLYAVGAGTFSRSVNGGTSWTSKVVDPGGARIAISTTIAAPQNIYLLVSIDQDRARFYLSTNSGDSFALKIDTPNVMAGQRTLDIAIEASPTNAATIYAGILDFYKSTNMGSAFTVKTAGAWGVPNYMHVDVHDIEIRNGVIYVASDGGIYKSTDAGNTWQEKNNGLSVAWIVSLAHAPAFPDLFYFGSWDNGLFKRTIGTACKNLEHGDGITMAVDPTDQNTAYGLLPWSFSKTTDGGDTFSRMPVPTAGLHRYLVIDQTNANNLYLAANGVYKSTDKGASWVTLNADSSAGRSCLDVSVSNPSFVYSATRPGATVNDPDYFQRYNGTNWTSCRGNLPAVWNYWFCPSDVVIDPANHLHVWTTFLGTMSGNKVFETFNGGNTWFNRSGSLPNVFVNCIAYAPGSNNGVYIGTSIGVFYKDNTFTDWVPFLNGLPRTSITDLVIDSVSNSLYAGTCGRGIWKSDLFSACPPTQIFSGAPFDTQTGFHFYEASSIIETDRFIEGNYGNNITYKAGNYIKFNPGFEAKAGSEVKARIGLCTGSPARLPLTGNYEELHIKAVSKELPVTEMKTVSEDGCIVAPNPFSEFTNIKFNSRGDMPITVTLTDVTGRVYYLLINKEVFSTGQHNFDISTTHLKNGVYFVSFRQGGYEVIKKTVKL